MSQNFSFSSYLNTKLQLSNKNISTHTHQNFKFLPRSQSKVQAFFFLFLLFSLYHAIQKGNQVVWQNHVRISVPRSANALSGCLNGLSTYRATFLRSPNTVDATCVFNLLQKAHKFHVEASSDLIHLKLMHTPPPPR